MSGRYDVLILGGGIIGGALAEALAKRRQRVCVLERGTMGCEASNAAAGVLSAQTDLESPGPLFEFCQHSRRLYPGWIRRLERASGLSLGYHEDGILYLAFAEETVRRMEQRLRWQVRLGYKAERWSVREARRREPQAGAEARAGFFFPTEAQLLNATLMQALRISCRKAGVVVRERTEVLRVLTRGGRVTAAHTDRGTFHAPVIVNCLGSWASLGDTLWLKPPVVPAKGQMLGFQAPKGFLRHIIMSEGGYAVQHRDGYLIAGSTVEFVGFDKHLTLDGMQRILSGLRRMVGPALLDRCLFVDSWVGLRPCAQDRLPILGATPIEGLYAATAHFRHGILLAPVTAQAISELILTGCSSFDLSPFSLSRFARS